MIQDHLQKELDRKNFFFVRYAIYINLLITGIVVFSLCVIKIDNQSIFSMFLNYYFKQY